MNGAGKGIVASLLLLVAAFVPPAARADIVAAPDTSICPSTGTPPVIPGTTPGAPGTWANPDRAGEGWNFYYFDNATKVIATLYTYDGSGTPVWLTTPVVAITRNANNEQTFSAELQKKTYSYPAQAQSSQDVGSVAVTFVRDSTTQAAIRWKWDVVGTQNINECLYDFFRDAPPASQPPESSTDVGESYTGLWGVAVSRQAWGMSYTFGIDSQPVYAEVADVHFFDGLGQPVWLSGQNQSAVAPQTSATNIPLFYVRAKRSVYPIGGTCNGNDYCLSMLALSPTQGPAQGAMTRTFDGPASGSVAFAVNIAAASTGTGRALVFPPPGSGIMFPQALAKVDQANEVFVSTPLCQAPVGENMCGFEVSWNGIEGSNRLWRYDINAAQYSSSSIGSGAVGTISEALPVGSFVNYELRSSAGAVLGRSSSVRVVAAPQEPGAAVPSDPQLAATPARDIESDRVGSTAGQISVDQSGNAQYRIPLLTPRGAGGLTPDLALVYNSGSGDGLLGYGWQVQGFSAITLCRRAPEHGDGPDSTGELTTNPASSAYCLDGQRMMLVSSGNGALGAVYRLENDNATKIVVERADTTDGQGSSTYIVPTIFTVYSKDGTIRRYGLGARLRQPTGTGGVTLVWYQYELRDANNNVVNYNYSTPSPAVVGNAALVPQSIVYAGGEITFSTTPRPTAQQVAAYQGGIAVTSQAVWLTGITVKASGVTLRTYKPAYDETRELVNPSLRAMTSLQECGGSGTNEVCYPATRFDWAPIDAWLATTPSTQTRAGADSFFHAVADAVKFGDFDGDGRTDTLFLHCDDSSCDYRDFFVGYSAPSTASGIGLNFSSVCGGTPPYDPNGTCPQFSKFLSTSKGWQTIDYNADGRSDLLMLEPVSGRGDVPPYRGVVWQSGAGNVIGAAAANPFTQKILNIARNPQTGVTGPMQFNGKVELLNADFDGDGMPDLLTVGSGGGAANAGAQVWLLKATGTPGQPYVYQGPYQFVPRIGGSDALCGFVSYATQSLRTADFNGDGKADLVMRTGRICTAGTRGDGTDDTQLVDSATFDAAVEDQPKYLEVFKAGKVEGSYFVFNPLASLSWTICEGQCTQTTGPLKYVMEDASFQVADINGDGLADVLFPGAPVSNNATVWLYEINQNGTRGPSTCAVLASPGPGCAQTGGAQQTQLGDYDGDGKADFWTVEAMSGSNKSVVHLWSGNAFSSTQTVTAMQVGDLSTSWLGYLVDMDGDGTPDSLQINPIDSHGAWQVTRTSAHHKVRNVISSITSGLGALTAMDYAPMTYRSVYSRETSAPSLTTAAGWHTPVQDVTTPRFVVQYLDSSVPVEGQVNALSTIRYRYSGYKMQGGGRGSLGFREIMSIDAQTGLQTITTYNQVFPLLGTPTQTRVYTAGETVDTLCASPGSPDDAACMFRLPLGNVTGSQLMINEVQDNWAWHVYGAASDNTPLGGAAPVFVYKQRSLTRKYDLDGGLLSSNRVYSTYEPSRAELLAVDTLDYSSANQSSTNVMREVTTTNTYEQDVDVAPSAANAYVATWHVGRLTSTTTTSSASGLEGVVAATYPTRKSSFEYDPTTGQLLKERVEAGGPADQALSTHHLYDTYGNETKTVTCADSVAGCSSALTAASMTFQPTDPNWVQRYKRTNYPSGIYANAVFEPFSSGSAATEYQTLKIDGRDAFGNVTDSTDANGLRTVSAYGPMGRSYFTATNSGGASTTTYRWCIGYGTVAVTCPAGAAYRVDFNASVGATTARAPQSWTYFDVLARPMLRVTQGFAATEYIAVKTTYDNLGRVYRVTEPYFTYAPASAQIGNAVSGTFYATASLYDVLGRPKTVTHPNGKSTTYSYAHDGAGLPTTKVTLPINNASSGVAETRTQTANHVGQVVTVTDALGSTLSNTYDANGNLAQTTRTGWDGKSATTTIGYDAVGRRKSLADPDSGSWNYAYNALGELVKRWSSTSCEKTQYDGRGRAYARSSYANGTCTSTAETTATWSYDTATSGRGVVSVASGTDGGIPYARQHYYDGFGRLRELDTTISSGTTASYFEKSTYDEFGRPFQTLFWGSGIPETGELYQYNAQGYREYVRDAEYQLTGQAYQQVLAMDARGNIKSEQRAGNTALTTTRTYRPDTGWLSDIATSGGVVQQLHYDYDALGNMVGRNDTSGGLPGGAAHTFETFAYDALQRQTTAKFMQPNGAVATLSSSEYDSFGNIKTTNGNASTYAYGGRGASCTASGEVAAGPDAVVTLGTNTYCYDARGNQTRTFDTANSVRLVKRKQTYTSYDALRTSDLANIYTSHTTSWAYGPERQRLVRSDYTNPNGTGTPTVTHFVGSAEITTAPGSTQRVVKRYVPGMVLSQVVANNSTVNQQHEFLFTDNLGSTHRITDDNGNVLGPNGTQAFTPFGSRADPNYGTTMDQAPWFGFDASLTHHGFTGHEMMDETDLIHMNGRVYDPRLARFIQADPFVQDAGNLQSYNRYSYVLNNPLTTTDPTGYWGHRQQGYVRTVAAIAVTLYTGYYYGYGAGAAAAPAEAATGTIMSGFISGFITSGNLQGSVLGAFDAALNFGIGSTFSEGSWGNIGAHALEGGVLEHLRGGRFGHGFVTAGLTATITPIETGHPYADGIEMAMIGGTISAVTGGKFANGALTAAFEYAYNHELHKQEDNGLCDSECLDELEAKQNKRVEQFKQDAQTVAKVGRTIGDGMDIAVTTVAVPESALARLFSATKRLLGITEAGGKASKYLDTTLRGSRYANRTTDVSIVDFEKNLVESGWARSVSQDGKVILLEKDGARYTLRENAKSTGGPTAEYFAPGADKPLKIRLGQDEKP
ncbi:RHS repeat-associated protein [Dokdonella fugitiva]|uniref:RHS repeat-associated protein n=1 Tax=Dokdonella fugitiva TaxID=328517 RepID=A0A839F608_9GAMM|nr:FG-GAP-like repeat-containing protein [Dokdonella fugitiva]MBA8889502.1 RHS repeat-associated protein [Dokdonella fugitiva]